MYESFEGGFYAVFFLARAFSLFALFIVIRSNSSSVRLAFMFVTFPERGMS